MSHTKRNPNSVGTVDDQMRRAEAESEKKGIKAGVHTYGELFPLYDVLLDYGAVQWQKVLDNYGDEYPQASVILNENCMYAEPETADEKAAQNTARYFSAVQIVADLYFTGDTIRAHNKIEQRRKGLEKAEKANFYLQDCPDTCWPDNKKVVCWGATQSWETAQAKEIRLHR